MPSTKGIRLNASLRKQFEDFCRVHLLDERAVIEAWLVRFLEASDEERKLTAKRYADWMAKDTVIESDRVPKKATTHKPGRKSSE